MEPVDPRLESLLGGSDSGGGPDELRKIVARAGRHRIRITAVAAALALCAGGGIGYAASSTGGGGSTQQVVASSPTSGDQRSGGAAVSPPLGSYSSADGIGTAGGTMTKLFTRKAGTIDIRGYLWEFGGANGTNCLPGVPQLEAEVSTPNMVGVASAWISGSGPTEVGTVLGLRESDPTAVVVVNTPATVALVRMTFAGGATDQMSPVQGWSVLAAADPSAKEPVSGPVTLGNLTFYNAAGGVTGTATVQWPSAEPLPEGPLPAQPPPGQSAPQALPSNAGVSSSGGSSSASSSAASGSGNASGGATGSAGSAVAYPCKVRPGNPGGNICPPNPPTTAAPPTSVNGKVAYAYPCVVMPPGPTSTTLSPPESTSTSLPSVSSSAA